MPSLRMRENASFTYSAPAMPATLTSSCGSATMPVVPWLTASCAKASGDSSELSTWMCPSMSPGRTISPSASKTAPPSYPCPMAAIFPPFTATSAFSSSPVNTLRTLAPLTTRSHFLRFMAQSMRSFIPRIIAQKRPHFKPLFMDLCFKAGGISCAPASR